MKSSYRPFFSNQGGRMAAMRRARLSLRLRSRFLPKRSGELRRFTMLFLAWALILQLLSAGVSQTAAADPEAANLLSNPGFEAVSGGAADDWYVIGSVWGSGIETVSEAAYSGNYGVSIQTAAANNPWVMQMVPVEEGAAYEFASRFRTAGVSGNVGYKIEYYNNPDGTAASFVKEFAYYAPAAHLDGSWHDMKFEQVTPEGASYVKFYLRLYGTGKVYFDDAAAVKTKNKPQLVVNTDHVYYYPDLTHGQIHVAVEPEDGVMTGKTIEIALRDAEEGELVSQTGLPAAADISVSFDPRDMELRQPYRIEAVMRDTAGLILESQEKIVYRWERPAAAPGNGPILVDGEPFFPVIAYHAEISDYPYLQEAGVNTVQGYNTTDLDALQARLDAAHSSGLKMLVPLYNGMKVKENADLTFAIVNRFKTHPALLGYMIMDEPTYNGIPQQELLDAYKLVRSLDPNHVTYMVEASSTAYGSTGAATDILVTDVYPLNQVNMLPFSKVGEGVRKAIAAVDDVKPVWTVLQTTRIPFDASGYTPSIGEVRNMAYQALLAGSKGLGYYSFNDPGWKLRESGLWPGLVEFKDELALMGELVAEGSAVYEDSGDAVQTGIWRKDSEYYAVAVNTSKETRSFSIPLDRTGNQIELLYGAETMRFGSWDAALGGELGPEQAFMYRVTPFAAPIDEAIGEWEGVVSLILDGQWQAKASRILGKIQKVSQALLQPAPDEKRTMNRTANLFKKLSQLEDWADQQSDAALEGKRGQLLASIEAVRAAAQPIVQSAVQLAVQADPKQAAPGDEWEVSVTMLNSSEKKLKKLKLTVNAPNEWGIPETAEEVGSLSKGQSYAFDTQLAVPEAAQPGVYPVTVKAEYEYRGVSFAAEQKLFVHITPLLEAKLVPERLDLYRSGTYPFAVNLTSRVNRALSLELTKPAAGGIGFDIATSVELAPYESKTVQGQVTIPGDTVIRSVYAVQVEVKAGGTTYAILPLTVDADTSAVYNGGFEKQAAGANRPDGWYMRAGSWDKTAARSGQASVRLDPDAGNEFNVLNSDLTRGDGAFVTPVQPGHTYILSGWVKNGSTAGSVALGVRQVAENNVSVTYNWFETQPGSDWTKVVGTFTPLPQTKAVQVYFKMDPEANGSAWLDDLELTEAPVLTDVTVGPVAAGSPVSAVSSKDGVIYLVPGTTAANAAAIEAAGRSGEGRFAAVTQNVYGVLDTTGLAANLYKLYAIDASGNVSAGSGGIAVIDPAAQPAMTDNEDAIVQYGGNWNLIQSPLHFGGSARMVYQQGAYVDIPFYGDGAKVIGLRNSVYGKANIYIDGAYKETIDYYYPVLQYQQTIYDTGSLGEGIHSIRIEAAGTSNPATVGTWITFDALQVSLSAP